MRGGGGGGGEGVKGQGEEERGGGVRASDGGGHSIGKQRLLCWRAGDSVYLRNCTAALLLS